MLRHLALVLTLPLLLLSLVPAVAVAKPEAPVIRILRSLQRETGARQDLLRKNIQVTDATLGYGRVAGAPQRFIGKPWIFKGVVVSSKTESGTTLAALRVLTFDRTAQPIMLVATTAAWEAKPDDVLELVGYLAGSYSVAAGQPTMPAFVARAVFEPGTLANMDVRPYRMPIGSSLAPPPTDLTPQPPPPPPSFDVAGAEKIDLVEQEMRQMAKETRIPLHDLQRSYAGLSETCKATTLEILRTHRRMIADHVPPRAALNLLPVTCEVVAKLNPPAEQPGEGAE